MGGNEENSVNDNTNNKFKIDWDKYINKTYILHLESRENRKKITSDKLNKIETLTGSLLDKVTWWKGYYGETEWDENIHVSKYSFLYHWTVDPSPKFAGKSKSYMESVIMDSSLSESNVSLGHADILKDIVKKDIGVGLIMEDDILPSSKFTETLDEIFKNELPEDWDVLYLSTQTNHGFKWTEHSEHLLKVSNGVWWFSGVVISQKAAQKLVKAFPIIGPIDVWINHQFKDLDVYMCKKNIIHQNWSLGSDNEHSFFTKWGL